MITIPRVSSGFGLASLIALAGCGGGYEDYYPDRDDPSVVAVEPAFELGNAGGQVVTVQGRGFGDDPNDVIVLIDNHNAEILSVNDFEIAIRTPPGPITGGPVDVLVATDNGYTLVDDRSDNFPLYEYGTADFSWKDGEFYTGQKHYVQVTNVYDSCYGGIGSPVGGCQSSAFNGQTGIDGGAEFLRFAYPRLHTTGIGWLTGFDAAIGEWRVADPSPVFPNGIDDLRIRMPQGLTITNPEYFGEKVWVDLVVGPATGTDVDPDGSGAQRLYDLGVMEFCEGQDPESGGTYQYSPDWAVDHDFFQPGDGALPDDPVTVLLDVPDLGILRRQLTLPPPVDLDAEAGFDITNLPWAISPTSRCNDTNEDGEATLDEDGMILTWTPVVGEGEDIEGVLTGATAVNSYLHVSFSSVDFTWYGLETIGVRASTVVEDINEPWIDEFGAAKSRLRIPNEILYQLPSPNTSWTQEPSGLGEPGRLGTFSSNPRYLFMEVYRVTDYRVEQGDETLIFSYSTGELTLLGDWDNPMTRTRDCLDCIDGDGDGWVDALDPDCDDDYGGNGDSETNPTSEYTCNDGIDNNRDGLIDAEDPLCSAGWDGESSCGDGLDNDGDTWVDELDPDCIGGDAFTQEDGTKTGGTCNDGLDNDGDGWIDGGDPNCENGLGDEVGGFGSTACNDGVDQDGHEDPDHLDVYCILNGALTDSEAPNGFSQCAKSSVNDEDNDGYLNEFDPDCEYRPYNTESDRFHDPTDETKAIVLECYDGIDNNDNGIKDADEPSCWNQAFDFRPDGFLASESTDRGTQCTSGVDEDGDGWIDGLDPDCQPGSPDTQVEVGLTDTECNNGIDDDGDGAIDAADSRCTRGSDNYEGPR